MDRRFPRMTKNKISEFSLEEARGWIIGRLYQIEKKMDFLLIKYFKPEDRKGFEKIMLSSNILGFVTKVKILRGLEIIDNKDFERLTKIARIRNYFAHLSTFESMVVQVPKDGGEGKITSASEKMEVMNSRGVIKTEDARDLINVFFDINSYLSEKLNAMIKA